jgi:hypothetical protein
MTKEHVNSRSGISWFAIGQSEEHRQGKGKRISGQWVLNPIVDVRGRNPLAREEAVQADDVNGD